MLLKSDSLSRGKRHVHLEEPLAPKLVRLPGSNEQPHEVDLGVLILRNHHLVTDSRGWRPTEERGRLSSVYNLYNLKINLLSVQEQKP